MIMFCLHTSTSFWTQFWIVKIIIILFCWCEQYWQNNVKAILCQRHSYDANHAWNCMSFIALSQDCYKIFKSKIEMPKMNEKLLNDISATSTLSGAWTKQLCKNSCIYRTFAISNVDFYLTYQICFKGTGNDHMKLFHFKYFYKWIVKYFIKEDIKWFTFYLRIIQFSLFSVTDKKAVQFG